MKNALLGFTRRRKGRRCAFRRSRDIPRPSRRTSANRAEQNQFSNQTALRHCLRCPIGKTAWHGSASCVSCAVGKYGANCSKCAKGRFRAAGSEEDKRAETCEECIAGFYQAEEGHVVPSVCSRDIPRPSGAGQVQAVRARQVLKRDSPETLSRCPIRLHGLRIGLVRELCGREIRRELFEMCKGPVSCCGQRRG